MQFNEVEKFLLKNNDTTYFVNFWATWCMPCIKEIPYIEKIGLQYSHEKFKILLVSLDFPSQIEKGLKQFIVNNNIKSEVWFLDEKDPNSWINKVNGTWSGAIPASVIYNKNHYKFYERSFEYEELDTIINSILIK